MALSATVERSRVRFGMAYVHKCTLKFLSGSGPASSVPNCKARPGAGNARNAAYPAYPAAPAAADRSRSRSTSTRRRIFPDGDFGISSRSSTARRRL